MPKYKIWWILFCSFKPTIDINFYDGNILLKTDNFKQNS